MHAPKELDRVLSLFLSDGETSISKQISDPKLRPTLKYLEAKGLVKLEEAEDGKILMGWLTNIGIAYVNEGGFSAIEKKSKEISHQKTKDRRFKVWSSILLVVLGSLLTLIVEYIITLIR